MSDQLTEKEIAVIIKIDTKIKELYKKKDEVFQKLFKKKGLATGFVKVEGEEKPFHRVKMVDNFSEDVLEGKKPAFSTAKFSRYTFTIDKLKNEPKQK